MQTSVAVKELEAGRRNWYHPVAFSVDRGRTIADPIGKTGRTLEVTYQGIYGQ
ncbi:MAG: hypothetical protein V8S95_09315 [Odoribacter sp.]